MLLPRRKQWAAYPGSGDWPAAPTARPFARVNLIRRSSIGFPGSTIARSVELGILMIVNSFVFPWNGAWQAVLAACCVCCSSALAAPTVLDPELQIRNVLNTGSDSFRLVLNPDDGHLYYLKINGNLYRVNLSAQPGGTTSTLVASSNGHHVTSAAGFAIGPDGTFYLTGNTVRTNHTVGLVTKGVLNHASSSRTWSVLAQTVPIPGGSRIFNHQMNAIVLSPDGKSTYVNIGARTDHGEVQSDGGLFPGLREAGLTTIILVLPAQGSNIVLPNNRDQLRQLGYLFCEGVRNTYDLAFSAKGELFGLENGPDRDMPEELNWLRAGHHFGFPWRMGTEDNPQQFPNYDPSKDKLLNQSYYAVGHGTYQNDPTFPPPPAAFTDPVLSVGPDADRIRDPLTGAALDASDLGRTIGTFTAHRCPQGLTFDKQNALGSKFTGNAFAVSWTPGLASGQTGEGPFADPSQDLLHLKLIPLGTTDYQVQVTRIVGGFQNPVDTEIIENKIYVLENGGSQGLWEVTFPAAPRPLLTDPAWLPSGIFRLTLRGTPNTAYVLEASSSLSEWNTLTNYNGSDAPMTFSDTSAPASQRFYRARPR